MLSMKAGGYYSTIQQNISFSVLPNDFISSSNWYNIVPFKFTFSDILLIGA